MTSNLPFQWPEVFPKPEWKAVPPLPGFSYQPSFVSGHGHPDLIQVTWYYDSTTQSGFGDVIFGNLCEGPPGTAHGGAMAALLDEAMGSACWMIGVPVVAAHINMNFQMGPQLGRRYLSWAQVVSREGRKNQVDAGLYDLETKERLVSGHGLFIELPEAQQQAFQAFSIE